MTSEVTEANLTKVIHYSHINAEVCGKTNKNKGDGRNLCFSEGSQDTE